MKMIHKTICLLLAVLMLLPLAGCFGGQGLTEEEIFTKNIHDFEGHTVENLDEQENTNFIVYEKGVQEITLSDERNVLLSADEENLVYTFANPDEQLLSMKEGDVFWGMSQTYEAVSVKVASTRTEGSNLVIQGEEVTLSDLFTYVDINMDVGYEKIFVDPAEVPEGTSVEMLSAPAQQNASVVSLGLAGDTDDFDIPVGMKLQTGLNISKDAVKLEGSICAVIESITVKFRFAEGKLYTAFIVNGTENVDLNISAKGSFLPPVETLISPVQVPVGGPVLGKVYVYGVVSLNGQLEIGCTSTQRVSQGFVGEGLDFKAVDEKSAPEVTPRLEEISGSFEAGLKLRVGLSCLNLADIYGSAYGGIEFKGEYDPFDMTQEEGKDAVHDCKACIDGDASLVARVSVGADIGMFPGQKRLFSSEITIMEVTQPLCKFYISFGAEGKDEWVTESGWDTTCPYKRYRTVITVIDQDGNQAKGADLVVTCPDGRTYSGVTDGGGQAEFYLPEGDNLVRGSMKGQKGKVHVMVVDQPPITALLRLEHQQGMYIFYECLNYPEDHITYEAAAEFDHQELYDLLVEHYPDAVFVNIAEWTVYGEGGIYWDDGAYEALLEELGIGAGDLIIEMVIENRYWDRDEPYVQGERTNPGFSGYSCLGYSVYEIKENEQSDGTTKLLSRYLCGGGADVKPVIVCAGCGSDEYSDMGPLASSNGISTYCRNCESLYTEAVKEWNIDGGIHEPYLHYQSGESEYNLNYEYRDITETKSGYSQLLIDAVNSGVHQSYLTETITPMFEWVDTYLEEGIEGVLRLSDEKQVAP